MANHLPPATSTAPTATGIRCPVHHVDTSRCPVPALANVLDTLRDLGIDPVIVGPVADLDPCGSCREQSDWPVEDAVCTVVHTSRDGRDYPTTCCPLCVTAEVRWHQRNHLPVRVEVPSEIAAQVTV